MQLLVTVTHTSRFLFSIVQSVIRGRIGFLQIGFFNQFLTLGAQQRRQWEFTPAPLLEQDGLYISGIVGLVFVGSPDGGDDFLAPIQPNQVG